MLPFQMENVLETSMFYFFSLFFIRFFNTHKLCYAFKIFQCNVPCGPGYRLRESACTRIYPKSPDNPHPIKNGKKVDPKFCSHLSLPKYSKMKKDCNRPCDFKWEFSQWSKVIITLSLLFQNQSFTNIFVFI
jgi:hypothetical protein